MSAITFRPEFPIGFGRTDASDLRSPYYITSFEAALLSVGFSFSMIDSIQEVIRFGGEIDLGPHSKTIETRRQEILKAMEAGNLSMYQRNVFPVRIRPTNFAEFKTWANIHRWALPEWMRTSKYAVSEPLEVGNPVVNYEVPGPVSALSAKTESEFALLDPTKTVVTPILASGQITQAGIGIASDPKELAVNLEVSHSSAVLHKLPSSRGNLDRHTTRRTKEELLAFVRDPKNLVAQGTNRIRTSAEITRAFHKYIMSPEYTGSLVDRPPVLRTIENLLSKLRREGQWKPLSPRREQKS